MTYVLWGKNRFVFIQQMWSTEEGCEEVIESAWTFGANLETKMEACAGTSRSGVGISLAQYFEH